MLLTAVDKQIKKMPKVSKHKDISKNVIAHPNSRKTAQIAKKNVKASARDKQKVVQQVKLNLLGEKVLWFKDHLLPDVLQYSPEQTIDIIELYLQRFDEELEQIKLKHSIGQRKGRQHASREDIINLTLAQEVEEFKTCGLECPDIMNPKQLNLLRKWEGELRYIQNFKLKRFSVPALNQAIKQLPRPPREKKVKTTETSTEEKTPEETSQEMDTS